MKPGYKTSEFYITVATLVSGLMLTTGVITPDQHAVVIENADVAVTQAQVIIDAVIKVIGAVMAIASAVGYTMSRGLAKKGETK